MYIIILNTILQDIKTTHFKQYIIFKIYDTGWKLLFCEIYLGIVYFKDIQ